MPSGVKKTLTSKIIRLYNLRDYWLLLLAISVKFAHEWTHFLDDSKNDFALIGNFEKF
jgi:hypothetical protein